VIVVVGADSEEPELPPGVRIARDVTNDGGPLVGLSSGLAGISTPVALVVAGDMPDLVPSVLRLMIRTSADREAEAVVLQVAGDAPPLPCVLGASAREVAQRLLEEGESSLRALLGALKVETVPESAWRALDPTGATLRDVDTPDQLR
jgi:molybdopterin-guanine dinucleotide biosynthesis protein A